MMGILDFLQEVQHVQEAVVHYKVLDTEQKVLVLEGEQVLVELPTLAAPAAAVAEVLVVGLVVLESVRQVVASERVTNP